MSDIQHLDSLRKKISTYHARDDYKQEGFVPIGYGDKFNEKYNIPREAIYCLDKEGGSMFGNKLGNLPDVMYYVSNYYYKNYIMESTLLRKNLSEQVKLAEQYIGTTVHGIIHDKGFVPDAIRVCNKYCIPAFLKAKDRERLEGEEWMIIIESLNDYASLRSITEVKSFKLNDNYTAVIEGEKVQVGCQTFDKSTVLKLAEYIING